MSQGHQTTWSQGESFEGDKQYLNNVTKNCHYDIFSPENKSFFQAFQEKIGHNSVYPFLDIIECTDNMLNNHFILQ